MVTARILIVAPEAVRQELRGTVLFGSGKERALAADTGPAFQMALAQRPSMVLVDGAYGAAAVALIQRLREHHRTRRCSIVALSHSPAVAEEDALRAAGANLVVPVPVDASRWNPRLEKLLLVPPRREARFPVSYEFWSGEVAGPEAKAGYALDISVHGLLLETQERLDLGARLDLDFELPHRPGPVRALGQVVREARSDGPPRSGVEFLILRGNARARIGAFARAR